MKRRLFMVLLLFVAGAIVNVAVGCAVAPFRHHVTMSVIDKATQSPAADVHYRVSGDPGINVLRALWPSDVVGQTDTQGQARLSIPNWDIGTLHISQFPIGRWEREVSSYDLRKDVVKKGGQPGVWVGSEADQRYIVTLQPGWSDTDEPK